MLLEGQDRKSIIENGLRTGDYTIQVAAYRDVVRAKNLKNSIDEKFKGSSKCQVFLFHNNTDSLIRVFVGSFRKKNEAEEVLVSLSSKGFEGYIRCVPKVSAEDVLMSVPIEPNGS